MSLEHTRREASTKLPVNKEQQPASCEPRFMELSLSYSAYYLSDILAIPPIQSYTMIGPHLIKRLVIVFVYLGSLYAPQIVVGLWLRTY